MDIMEDISSEHAYHEKQDDHPIVTMVIIVA